MAPAFSSIRRAGAFVLLMLALLLSPLLVGKLGRPPREQVYSSISWRLGSFPYMCRQIFEEKGDIDIAFMGSSQMYDDIDTPYVQKQLSEKLGRQATVLSLCWNYSGYDAIYFFAKDLLEHRKVRLLVFSDDPVQDVPPNQPHVNAWRWVRVGDNDADLAALPLNSQISYYYGSIVGLPRNLLNRLRPNLSATVSPEQFRRQHLHVLFPPDRLGTRTSQLGYIGRPDLFVDYSPQTTTTPSDVYLYSSETRDKFQFSKTLAAPLQTYFASKFLCLAQDHGARPVCLKLPIISEQHCQTIVESRLSIDCLSNKAALFGIVPAKLFEGLGDDDVRKLYEDQVHMNQNGQAYFTRIITPELIQLYEQTTP
jgi:hypothetical protein